MKLGEPILLYFTCIKTQTQPILDLDRPKSFIYLNPSSPTVKNPMLSPPLIKSLSLSSSPLYKM